MSHVMLCSSGRKNKLSWQRLPISGPFIKTLQGSIWKTPFLLLTVAPNSVFQNTGCGAGSLLAWPIRGVGLGLPSAHLSLLPTPEPTGCWLAPIFPLLWPQREPPLGGHPSVIEASPFLSQQGEHPRMVWPELYKNGQGGEQRKHSSEPRVGA